MYTADAQQASNFVGGVNLAFLIILGISILFLVALTVIMLVFIRKYRKERHPKAIQNEGSNKLEALWTGIPLILVLVMFYFGWMGWKPMKNPPDDAMHIKAIARMWQFQFEYENGKFTDSLIVPLNEPVILDLVAMDVLHALYIPAFRVKEDMVPGRDKNMWFIPGSEGEYDLFCAEYCGQNHSYMTSGVRVIPKEQFDAWLADTSAVVPVAEVQTSPAQQGYELIRKNGCIACHSSDGSRMVGPSFKGIWGETQTVTTGREERQVKVDEDYVRKSIYDPGADVVKGYNSGLMQSYKDQVSEEDVGLIIEYLKSLNE
jgi:cytochrome c oxidase subunit II